MVNNGAAVQQLPFSRIAYVVFEVDLQQPALHAVYGAVVFGCRLTLAPMTSQL